MSKRIIIAILSLMAIAISAPAVSAMTYLVSVGVSDYPGKGRDLRLPREDARAITNLYSLNKGVHYLQLLDSKATATNIVAAVNKLFSQAQPDDIIVFFFSGHGYKGGFNAYDRKLPYSEIRKAMNSSRAKNKMIFADTCFSGKITKKNKSATQNSSASTDDSSSNIMLFLSSRDNEKSIERRDMKNGCYTAALISALKGAADTNRDRTITARELFDYVSAQVKKTTRDRQHPVMWGNFDDNMPVMKW